MTMGMILKTDARFALETGRSITSTGDDYGDDLNKEYHSMDIMAKKLENIHVSIEKILSLDNILPYIHIYTKLFSSIPLENLKAFVPISMNTFISTFV